MILLDLCLAVLASGYVGAGAAFAVNFLCWHRERVGADGSQDGFAVFAAAGLFLFWPVPCTWKAFNLVCDWTG